MKLSRFLKRVAASMKANKTTEPELRICEGVAGTWHYHLTYNEKGTNALCGAQTMWSGSPLNSWGFKPNHMPTSYCHKCEKLVGLGEKEVNTHD